eukprot:Sspe_Gene.63577::Locus_36600_Transcript_1_1_Confidence_1.000_Length_868::g.63577::m.63577
MGDPEDVSVAVRTRTPSPAADEPRRLPVSMTGPTRRRHGASSPPVEPELRPKNDQTPAESIWLLFWKRTTVLVTLLLLQSMSQLILERYERLVADHVIVPLFLTMLVGAGGNAGNQATVRAITGLVTGEYQLRQFTTVLLREAAVGALTATALAFVAFLRVSIYSDTDKYGEAYVTAAVTAICLSLFSIVLTSVILGCALPFLLEYLGASREHAAPTIQVVMDILGVFITCYLCDAMLTGALTPMKTSK